MLTIRALVFGFALSLFQFAYAEDKSAYERAVAAIDGGDCKSAVVLLEKFKVENADNLRKHPDFARNVDQQIIDCLQRLQPSDKTRYEAYGRPPPRVPWTIRFETFSSKEVKG